MHIAGNELSISNPFTPTPHGIAALKVSPGTYLTPYLYTGDK